MSLTKTDQKSTDKDIHKFSQEYKGQTYDLLVVFYPEEMVYRIFYGIMNIKVDNEMLEDGKELVIGYAIEHLLKSASGQFELIVNSPTLALHEYLLGGFGGEVHIIPRTRMNKAYTLYRDETSYQTVSYDIRRFNTAFGVVRAGWVPAHPMFESAERLFIDKEFYEVFSKVRLSGVLNGE